MLQASSSVMVTRPVQRLLRGCDMNTKALLTADSLTAVAAPPFHAEQRSVGSKKVWVSNASRERTSQLLTRRFLLFRTAAFLFLALLFEQIAFSTAARAEPISFSETFQLGGSFELACCASGYLYGITSVGHDASLIGVIHVTSIAVSLSNGVSATDPNGFAGASWQVFVGPNSPGFSPGQQSSGFITYSSFASASPTQLFFAENDIYQPGDANTLTGAYDFTSGVLSSNATAGATLVGASNAAFPATAGMFVQVALWGGDVGFDETVGNVTVTVTGTIDQIKIASSLSSATAGLGYSAQLVSGGQPPFTLDVSGLPPGLSANDSDGTISGTPDPSDSDTYEVTVTAADSLGALAGPVTIPLTVVDGDLNPPDSGERRGLVAGTPVIDLGSCSVC
jgi:hypothetical protein